MKSKYIKIGISTLILFFLSGCVPMSSQNYVLFQDKSNSENSDGMQTKITTTNTQENSYYEYRIVPHNRLSVLVYNHPELSTRDLASDVAPDLERGILVSADGTINLPLIGTVQVAGLTAQEAANLLTNEYSKFIRNAHVTLDVLNKRVYVMGEVREPGSINITNETLNLLEAIADVGGFTDYAERNTIKIIRGTTANPEVKTVDLTDLRHMSSTNLTLYPNDVIYIAPNALRRRNLAIAEMLPGIEIVQTILSTLYTGKQLTNTRIFNVHSDFR